MQAPSQLPKIVRKTAADGTIRLYFYDRKNPRVTYTQAEYDAMKARVDAGEQLVTVAPATAPARRVAAMGPDMLLGDAIDSWQRSPQWADLSAATQVNYLKSLGRPEMKPFLRVPASQITTYQLAQVKNAIAMSGLTDPRYGRQLKGSANQFLNTFAAIYHWGMEHVGLAACPASHVSRFQQEGGHTPWSDDEIRAYIAVVPPGMRRAIMIALHTALRLHDVLAITWSAWDGEVIRYTPHKTRRSTGQALELRVTGEARAMLNAWKAEDAQELLAKGRAGELADLVLVRTPGSSQKAPGVWTQANWHQTWSHLRAKHSLPDRCMHGLRATMATRLIDAGVAERDAMQVTGHSTTSAFGRYVKNALQRRGADRAMGALEGLLPTFNVG